MTVFQRRDFLKTAAAATIATGLGSEVVAEARAEAVADSGSYPAPTGETTLRVANLNDLEQQAAKIIPPGPFAYIATGADNQWTMHENRRAFERYRLRPQYLVGGGPPDLKTTLLGHNINLPIITTPMAAQGLAHISAELGTARGTDAAGTLMAVSTFANKKMEDIAAATKGPKWFQLYLHDDRARSRELLQRAKAAGYSAVVFTIDAFGPGSSDDLTRLNFTFPPGLTFANSNTTDLKRSLSWEDVDFIQKTTDLPLILKGVLTADIAAAGVRRGVAAIQVSNHGGRQLDGSPATLDMLPSVVAAVDGRVPVIMDSGIRRGTDVFKALALGANAVALGRPILYGLALGGSAGVKSVYDRIRDELFRTMTIAGVSKISDIKKEYLAS